MVIIDTFSPGFLFRHTISLLWSFSWPVGRLSISPRAGTVQAGRRLGCLLLLWPGRINEGTVVRHVQSRGGRTIGYGGRVEG
jgi:hypothetical protein